MYCGNAISKNSGSGVDGFGTFTMEGGEISENTNSGVRMNGGIFTMKDGAKISRNSSYCNGAGVYVYSGTFTMEGGEISGNTVDNGSCSSSGVDVSGGAFIMEGGVLAGSHYIGPVVSGTYSISNGNGIIISRKKPASWDNKPPVYIEGTDTDLSILPAEGTTAVWATVGDKFGVLYKNGTNEGFVEFPDIRIGTEEEIECLVEGGEWENGRCKTKKEICEATEGKAWENNACRNVIKYVVATESELNEQILAYATAADKIVIEIKENITLTSLISIPESYYGSLTIKSVNPAQPATLTRGIAGDLITIPRYTSLVLENIIIDGGKDGDFENGGGSLINVSGGFTMKDGTKITNNATDSWGGSVYIDGGSFIMEGGEISGNSADGDGGGVFVAWGDFTMEGGKISENSSGDSDISSGNGVYSNGTFTMNGGVIFGIGTDIEDVFYGDDAPTGGIAIAWDKPTGTATYNAGTSTGLTVNPTEATAVWAKVGGKSGISYKNGTNEGFVEVAGVTVATTQEDYEAACIAEGKIWENEACRPKTEQEVCEATEGKEWVSGECKTKTTPIHLPQIATGNIRAHAIANAIVLEGVPSGAKVEVYNLHGKRIYMGNPINPKIMKIMVQTKGMYIVKVNATTHRVMVK